MNIYDISKKTGFSTATISRVINGSASVSDKTREKILAVIDEYGYTPNVFARGLGLNTMKTIGIMCTDSSDRYIAQAVYYLEESLRKAGYDLILCCTGHDYHIKVKQMKLILSKRVDAVILVGSSYVEETDEMNAYILEAAGTVPVMMINGILNAPNIYCTVCDDYSAIYEVTDKLLSSGRTKPVYLCNSSSYSAKQKIKGYKDALKLHGIDQADKHILTISPAVKVGFVNVVRDTLLECGIDFDCVVASEDMLAMGAVKYAKAKGLKIPEELSVTGYNNFDLCECSEPELTSVDNKVEAVCEKCVSSLMQIFSDQARSVPKQTVYSCEIVKRGTTMF
ncbi:MAG: LacI family DNA-binding transcriptional regulator [Oscillospiraceae bacterium]|nr:LacI family DNA-binding transcriptional regulator [Oscillospiraceae bacterium]